MPGPLKDTKLLWVVNSDRVRRALTPAPVSLSAKLACYLPLWPSFDRNTEEEHMLRAEPELPQDTLPAQAPPGPTGGLRVESRPASLCCISGLAPPCPEFTRELVGRWALSPDFGRPTTPVSSDFPSLSTERPLSQEPDSWTTQDSGHLACSSQWTQFRISVKQ